MGFRERKADRIKWNKILGIGIKKVKCISCDGTGYYDDNGSPKCQSCNGSGKCIPPDYLLEELNKIIFQ